MSSFAILTAAFSQLLETVLPGCASFNAAWPGRLAGTDEQGHLIWVERLADINLAALEGLSDEELVLHRAQVMETLCVRKRAAGAAHKRLFQKHIYVLDCHGMNPLKLLLPSVRRILGVVSKVSSDCYTETLLRAYVVNAPPVLRVVWAALKPMMHPKTQAKVRIMGGKLVREAGKDGVSLAALPTFLGGGHECTSMLQAIEEEIAAVRAILAQRGHAVNDSASDNGGLAAAATEATLPRLKKSLSSSALLAEKAAEEAAK
jgi:hypothetical protein